jgi:hypothetical protein
LPVQAEGEQQPEASEKNSNNPFSCDDPTAG